MVFDVESVGLHGEGFAFGFVVIDGLGSEIQSGLFTCPFEDARGSSASRKWVDENVPKLVGIGLCEDTFELRLKFWDAWMNWKGKGAILAADCSWPVEANFLSQCVEDQPREREWQGPYPLIDIGSVVLANGGDPLAKFPRKENELPEHDPLADARQSARILIENL